MSFIVCEIVNTTRSYSISTTLDDEAYIKNAKDTCMEGRHIDTIKYHTNRMLTGFINALTVLGEPEVCVAGGKVCMKTINEIALAFISRSVVEYKDVAIHLMNEYEKNKTEKT